MARTICAQCGKPLDGSHKVYCKACFAAYVKARRDADPEAARAKEQAKHRRNPRHQYQRDYRAQNPEFWNEYSRKWRRENPESRKLTRRKGHLRSLYGLSIAQFEGYLELQENRCLICSDVFDFSDARSVHVDHCHDSGEVRAILCGKCNNGLGCFRDSPELLDEAAAYLRCFQEE